MMLCADFAKRNDDWNGIEAWVTMLDFEFLGDNMGLEMHTSGDNKTDLLCFINGKTLDIMRVISSMHDLLPPPRLVGLAILQFVDRCS